MFVVQKTKQPIYVEQKLTNLDSEPYLSVINFDVQFFAPDFSTILGILFIIIMLGASALISGSEVAFFSLTKSQTKQLEDKSNRTDKAVLHLLEQPDRLLSTILIANNFVNIGIIIVSNYVITSLFDFSNSELFGFLFQVVAVTFLLLLFGEIMPKVYATRSSLSFALFMGIPLGFLARIFNPLSNLLIYSTSFVNKRFSKLKQGISIDDLSDALEITDQHLAGEKKILQGIVNFGLIEVIEIMRPRVDVLAINDSVQFKELLEIIAENNYSRIPVFNDTFDSVVGILHIKDLLKHLDKPDDFYWQQELRPPYFVPENKKIGDLLEEFQTLKIHMAIVSDEYGGTSGIVTLEDILEEIVGEIQDEDDEEEATYKKIDDKTYIFDGKTLLNDFYKVMGLDNTYFEAERGDADTLAGLFLEMYGEIPKEQTKIELHGFSFVVIAATVRRIQSIKVLINS